MKVSCGEKISEGKSAAAFTMDLSSAILSHPWLSACVMEWYEIINTALHKYYACSGSEILYTFCTFVS